MEPIALTVANTNLIRLEGVRAGSTAAFLNNLTTVTGEVKDAAGAALSPAVTFTLAYVAGSDGRYEGPIAATAALVDGTPYRLVIDINAGVNLIGHIEYEAVGRTRKE